MKSRDTAVSIKDVTKNFDLPADNKKSVKDIFVGLLSKKNRGSRRYSALKGINLEIKKGEFVGILGRNGAGKSTLLKIIAEIYQPNSGSVKVNGRLVPFIELGVGFNKNLSGQENVYLNGAMLGFSKEEVDAMYDSIVDFAELHNFMGQKLRNYSSGMKVRLAFSIAIKARADILLLDEVLAVGDASFKRKCFDYFNTLKEGNKTIILVTHSMGAVRAYCDRAVLIENGKVAFDGSPEDAAEEYFSLFNEKNESKSAIENKLLTIEKIETDINQRTINFKIKVQNNSDENINDVLLRIAIKKQNGRTVAGFDNKNIEDPFEIDFQPHEQKTLHLEAENILGNGDFTINSSLSSSPVKGYNNDEDDDEGGDDEGDESTSKIVYDRKPRIASFSVVRPGLNAPIVLPAKTKQGHEE